MLIGDLHVPYKAVEIPDKFKENLGSGKIHQVLCTGNIGSKEGLAYLKKIAPSFTMVRGDQEEVR